MNTNPLPDRSPWFTLHDLPCIPSPTTSRALSSLSRCPPSVTDFRNLVSDRLLLCPVGVSQTSGRPRVFTPVFRSGLRTSPEGSSQRAAESCSSLSYGLHVRLRLLSTPRCGDAVTFDYPGAGISRGGDFRPSDRACSQARGFPLAQRFLSGNLFDIGASI
jgi:hypothetical protein